MARLHFYFHTIQSGENQTTMRIAGPAKTMVVGGSGLFRFTRGYSLLKTISFSPKTRNAVVEYSVTVVHFRMFLLLVVSAVFPFPHFFYLVSTC
ncbi:hypothetical protein NC651_009555 [Populus alba x Populus x berolinensis]|nr:hypothetical protein NC651_009555 [Populus alba x Populus x berolinensis]